MHICIIVYVTIRQIVDREASALSKRSKCRQTSGLAIKFENWGIKEANERAVIFRSKMRNWGKMRE